MSVGQCYPTSFNLLRQLAKRLETANKAERAQFHGLRLVHGEALLSDTMGDHAWIEAGGLVYDPSVDPVFVCPIKEYYEHYKALVRATYSHEESEKLNALVATLKSSKPQGGPGPWDKGARERRGLLPLPGGA